MNWMVDGMGLFFKDVEDLVSDRSLRLVNRQKERKRFPHVVDME